MPNGKLKENGYGGHNGHGLNPKQAKFVKFFIESSNATAAAKAAGYADKSAYETGCKLKRHPKVAAAIKKVMSKSLIQAEISAKYVVDKIQAVIEDPNAYNKDKLQALNLLGKHLGVFNKDTSEQTDNNLNVKITVDGVEAKKIKL